MFVWYRVYVVKCKALSLKMTSPILILFFLTFQDSCKFGWFWPSSSLQRMQNPSNLLVDTSEPAKNFHQATRIIQTLRRPS